MRNLIMSGVFVASVAAASLFGATAGVAQEYPWCANYGSQNGGTNCGFVSFRQCQAALSGNGGYCSENRFFHGSVERRATRREYRPYPY